MKTNFLFILIFVYFSGNAQNNLNIVPVPADVVIKKGSFMIDKNTVIIVNDVLTHEIKIANQLQEYLDTKHGLKLPVKKPGDNETKSKSITFSLHPNGFTDQKIRYSIEINKHNIFLRGQIFEDLFYAMQTLIQLLPASAESVNKNQIPVPQLIISDYPRFSYRGMHLDVGRHFFPISFIKKYIDYLASYKFNTFHWHLTEDQGWRIEIKKYPELTNTGAWRNGTIIGRYPGKGNDNIPYGGFYTQEEIKDVVQYAAARYIDVIPEIEMPGHSSAAIAAYPWLSCFPAKPTEIPANMISQKSIEEQKNGRIKLVQETWGVFDDVFCAGKDSTFIFLENVIDEVTSLFPSKYFHLGADESPKTHWKICPFCQKRMKDNNLKDEHELQSWFVQRIEKYVNSKGKIMIGWDEILEGGLAPNAVVMSWRGEDGGIEAAKQNHDIVMTPGGWCYFDHTQSKNEDSVTIGGYTPLEKVYSYEPVPAVLNENQSKHVLGAQGNVWTEYMTNTSKVEYMIFPRMIALSEVLWSPKGKRKPIAIGWKNFEKRLPTIFERLDKEKINYSRAYYDLKQTVIPTEDNNGVLWRLESNNKASEIRYSFPEGNSIDFKYDHPILITSDQVYTAFSKNKDGSSSNPIYQSFHFNKATGKKITILNQPSKSYPGNGAFTLVDGVQNKKGLAKSSEFLGFKGDDLDVTIDLGKDMDVSKVTLHVLKQSGSWIYLPSQVEVTFIPYFDTTTITKHSPLETITVAITQDENINKIEIRKEKICRYIHVVAKNYGIIPSGKPGAGNPAWLFVDEIEVD